jgi:hypothetical protein
LTQNCLAACGFNMIYYYIFSGWEGLHLTQGCFWMLMSQTLQCHQGNTTLLMLAFLFAPHLLFLSGEYTTIFKSGVMLTFSKFYYHLITK